jgi:hypothetical protein
VAWLSLVAIVPYYLLIWFASFRFALSPPIFLLPSQRGDCTSKGPFDSSHPHGSGKPFGGKEGFHGIRKSFPEKKFWIMQYDTALKISHITPDPSIPCTPSYKE